jgi:hypothetical protein
MNRLPSVAYARFIVVVKGHLSPKQEFIQSLNVAGGDVDVLSPAIGMGRVSRDVAPILLCRTLRTVAMGDFHDSAINFVQTIRVHRTIVPEMRITLILSLAKG